MFRNQDSGLLHWGYSDHVASVHTKNIHIRTPNSLHTSIKLGGFSNDNSDGNKNNVKKQKVLKS